MQNLTHGFRPTTYPVRIEQTHTRRLTVADVRHILDTAAQAQRFSPKLLTSDALDALAMDLHADLADSKSGARMMTAGRIRSDGSHVLIDSTDDASSEAAEWFTLVDIESGDTIDLSRWEAGRLGLEILDDAETFLGTDADDTDGEG